MASVFPYTNGTATTDAFSDPLSTSPLNSPSHSSLHTDVNTAVETIETILQSGGGSRNLLYNGAMQVAQRGTSTASITTSGYYTADRYNIYLSSLGTWTQTVENDAPTGSGFRKSWKMLCTTNDASPAASDALIFQQLLEGQDLQAVRKGTSQAQQLTLSFWVKANVTGTYVAELFDNDNARCCSKTYTVSSSGTWEFKTITFPADTTGALDNDNAASFTLQMWLGAGSTFTSGTLSTTWAAQVNANRAVGQVNLASATNNYWQITGVQLNVGSVAAPFEFKSFERDLRECQRYYEKSYRYGTAPGTGTFDALITMAYSAAAGTSGELGGHIMMTTYKRIPPNITWWDHQGNINKCTRLQAGVANWPNQSVVTGAVGEHYLGVASASGAASTSAIQIHFAAECEL